MTANKTLLRMKYADIVRTLAARTGMAAEEALRTFYESREYRLVSQGISDQHCMTPDYIVDDILAEPAFQSKSSLLSDELKIRNLDKTDFDKQK